MDNKDIRHHVVDFKAPTAGVEIYRALKESRFVILKNHGIPIESIETIKKDWQLFFSDKTKYFTLRTEESDEGFIPINFETASKELPADFKELYQTHYQGKYPSNIDLRATTALFTAMVELNEKICQLLDKYLPQSTQDKMPSSLFEMVNGTKNHLIRIIHYPPIDDKETTASRSAAHTDISLFTAVFGLLLDGLEFKDIHGQWSTPDIQHDEILFFNSEMIELCTNGLLRALCHQVKTDPVNKAKSRYAIPFNFHPYRSTELQPGLSAIQYLKDRLNQMGYSGEHLTETDH